MSTLRIAALTAAALLFSESTGLANGLLAPAAESDPSALDLAVAVAKTPYGTIRWSRVSVVGPGRVLWLVPARPGAAIDWAPRVWLDALDEATAPRVIPPTATPPCGMMPSGAERVATFGTTKLATTPTQLRVHSTESDARAHIAALGYGISPAEASRVAGVFATGGSLVSIELSLGNGRSSPTLRVADEGGAALPLALTGSSDADARVTAFVIARSAASVDGLQDLDDGSLLWGASGSTYAEARSSILQLGAAWLRESASRGALFEGFALPGNETTQAVVDGYFTTATCGAAARAVARSSGVVGRSCPPGDLARVPGGSACVPTIEGVDPAALACGVASIDLALALAGSAPKDATVTRLSGVVTRGALGTDMPISLASGSRSPIRRASAYEECSVSTPGYPSGIAATPDEPPPPDPGRDAVSVTTSQGCGGDTSTTSSTSSTAGEETASEESSSSTGCNGDTTTTSSSSERGWDDDDGGSDSGCGRDTSTSSEDSSDDSSSSSSDSDGWDSSDDGSDSCGGSSESEAAPKHAKKKPSRVSRYAMLLALFVLPLRRLRRFS